MTDELDEDMLLSETNVEGTCFDAQYYIEWLLARRTALWFWEDWETVMAYRDQLFRKAIAS
jgi:hypothetical protein